ncbi:molybdenum cofactor guanylyltransferase [Actinocrispum wychmicini]|uniref:Molybdopterin-guanine dinucleotide biosynthesis protein A n=1 Tax=Actinocrispum wychmicini TaxID=1213861 RepID=A0A4R2J595_9PSEU|nr:NTP transferase domain-containing protein [Actinocrispum wychmicini]TCO53464.1 molybdopterin-guanine dinucleotide biosynthesis protein A [Actinocrispum wychmicini]
MAFAAIVFAGGRASRLGGVDKVMIEVDGRTLLERSLNAVSGADPIVVVGPRRVIRAEVVWVREDPPGAGPVAALAAGVAALDAVDLPGEAHVAVLAGDLIGITADTVPRLRSTLDEKPAVAGAVLVDGEGYVQWMHGVWRLDALRNAGQGRSLKSVLGALPHVTVVERAGESADVDTPDDLRC